MEEIVISIDAREFAEQLTRLLARSSRRKKPANREIDPFDVEISDARGCTCPSDAADGSKDFSGDYPGWWEDEPDGR